MTCNSSLQTLGSQDSNPLAKVAVQKLRTYMVELEHMVRSEARRSICALTNSAGAPECYRSDPSQSTTPSQASDIWSIGCVLSEVITWIASGWDGLERFRKLRQIRKDVLKVLHKTHSRPDCFHDGTTVLEEVRDWHRHVRKMVRDNDFVTTQVLDLVDSSLLADDPKVRLKARYLHDKLIKIMGDAEKTDRLHRSWNVRSNVAACMDARTSKELWKWEIPESLKHRDYVRDHLSCFSGG